jgi:hypothetical protein
LHHKGNGRWGVPRETGSIKFKVLTQAGQNPKSGLSGKLLILQQLACTAPCGTGANFIV